MKKDTVIKVEHVSKKFCKSLKRSMVYGMTDIVKNAIGIKSNSQKLRKDEFWAVDDVSFKVKRGETLGIIGPNGSGKTTLLKMLNGIFWPDKGKITIKGRVGALIAVGAGFHPLLSGRENIYINAAILGLSRKEVDKRLDKIIDFADIGKFIDMPIRNYSSGMFIRLGFSVAIHCNPEILLIDEILSVGDLEFRSKSLNKLTELRNKSHAVVFVSHNITAIERICDRAILLDEGKIKHIGPAKETCSVYYESSAYKTLNHLGKKYGTKPRYSERNFTGGVEVIDVILLNNKDKESKNFLYKKRMTIVIKLSVKKRIKHPQFSIIFLEPENLNKIAYTTTLGNKNKLKDLKPGKVTIKCYIKEVSLIKGAYLLDIGINQKEGLTPISAMKFAAKLVVVETKNEYNMLYKSGYLSLDSNWEIN